MSVRLFALTCGWLTGPRALFVEGAPGSVRVPVPVFVVEHPGGLALFDSGLHRELRDDPAARLGVAASLFTPHFGAGDDVAARLASAGLDVGAVRWLVNSHLHFDHAGGNAAVPNATVVVQRREWRAAHDDAGIAANHYTPGDYDTGQPRFEVDGEHDLFGDGRVVCLPTYGHTPGHQSLLVRLDGGDVVLAADACYFRETLEELKLPLVVHDREAMLASLRRLRAFAAVGARIVYGHDPEAWAMAPQAPHVFA
ncbi:MAG: N-acyl homoserine lactonase family protein [Deltaproteobacteria bacterium]|nr:N-acyl homoserine lactonase family protein [Deltaproteobacteria bacterium]